MNRAFIFDMDGVLVDSESAWGDGEQLLLESMFGHDIAGKVDQTVGVSIQTTYKKAKELGASIPYKDYIDRYDEAALRILATAEITPQADALVNWLSEHEYRIALVSSSPQKWIDRVLARLPFAKKFEYVESLFEYPELRPKPEPDGYIEALRHLSAEPSHSFILEDSDPGIRAAKASGAFVIGFRGNLIEGYEQRGADAHADTMDEVITLVEKFTQ